MKLLNTTKLTSLAVRCCREQPIQLSPRHAGHGRVLLVVDDPAVARATISTFHQAGLLSAQISRIADLETGFKLIRTIWPDVVVIEISARDHQHLEFVIELRAKFPFVSVVAWVYSKVAGRKARKTGATVVQADSGQASVKLLPAVKKLIGSSRSFEAIAASGSESAIPMPTPEASLIRHWSPTECREPNASAQALDSFLVMAAQMITEIRMQFGKLALDTEDGSRSRFQKIGSKLEIVARSAKEIGFQNFSIVAGALGVLINEISSVRQIVSASPLHTFAQGIDLLGEELRWNEVDSTLPAGQILIIGDEGIDRNALVETAKTLGRKTVACHDLEPALLLVEAGDCDLCVIDLEMNRRGLEYSRQIRERGYVGVPILFLVPQINLEARLNLMLAKGTDLLAKPFLPSELALKALIHAERYRLGKTVKCSFAAKPSHEKGACAAPKDPKTFPPAMRASEVPPTAVVRSPVHFQIDRILVPVDFSPCSMKALSYALEFAREYGSQIDLLYVVPPFVGHDPYDLSTAERVEIEQRAEAERKLTTLVREQIPSGMKSETFIRSGRPGTEIIEKAKELRSDLIIISTHGYRGISEALQGSTTESVVRQAPCPMLVVRENEHEFLAS